MRLLLVLVGLLPASRIKNLLLSRLGRDWSVHREARVQPNLFWRVDHVQLGPQAYIGPGNVFRELRSVRLGRNAEIGQFNWVSAAAHWVDDGDGGLRGHLEMADHSLITSRHYVDCAGGVVLEERAVIGGVRSTVLSHSINPWSWNQEVRPIRIGVASVVLANVFVAAGVTVADRCIVAAGAVVSRDLDVSERLYGGVPAKVIADMTGAPGFDRIGTRDHTRDRVADMLRRDRQPGTSAV